MRPITRYGMTRLLLIAIATIALTAPASARPDQPRPFDAAAAPAYPHQDAARAVAGRRGHHAARRHRERAVASSAGLVTVQTAANIKITVHPAYVGKFQALIADLVRQGHKPKFITCYARGHKAGSNHAWGGACDIDQTGWGRTSGFMYHADSTIHANGLYSGCAFRDCGHVEAMRGLYNRPPGLFAAIEKFKADQSTARYQP